MTERPLHELPRLPELDDERVHRMESHIVSAHRDERTRRRRRVIGSVGSVAAVLALAAFVGPVVSSGGLSFGSSGGAASSADSSAGGSLVVPVAPESVSGSTSEQAPADGSSGIASQSADATRSATDGRDIVTVTSATVEVDSVRDALAALTDTARDLGGYVESSDISSDGDTSEIDSTRVTGGDAIELPYSRPIGSGYITIRVPADRLADAQATLATLGTVTQQSTNRQDVTEQTVDLRARVTAAQASVDRLTTLLGQAANVSDLIAAESALADRQAQLESLQQQLASIESQVSLSTLSVSVVPRTEVERAQPTGFLDGLVAGWNGLIASANGLFVGLGFLLPWLVVAGVVTAIVIGVRRLRARTRRR